MALNRTRWSLLMLVATLSSFSCRTEKSKDEADAAVRTEPWRAALPHDATEHGESVLFEIRPSSQATFTLRQKEPSIGGTVHCRGGELDVHLGDLAKSRGTLHFDLSSIDVTREGEPDPALTSKALQWLEVDADDQSRPDNLAQFQLERLEDLSVNAAHQGSKAKHESDGVTDGSSETRRVRATAVGQLTMHGFRVERTARIEIDFRYTSQARPGARPERIFVRSARSVPVSLSAHAIVPRTGDGHVIARELEQLRNNTGNEAHITAELHLAPKN